MQKVVRLQAVVSGLRRNNKIKELLHNKKKAITKFTIKESSFLRKLTKGHFACFAETFGTEFAKIYVC